MTVTVGKREAALIVKSPDTNRETKFEIETTPLRRKVTKRGLSVSSLETFVFTLGDT